MYAIGGNEEAARLSGLRVKRQKLAIYAFSGLFAAAVGIVLASRLSSAQPQAAQGYELDAIAAVVIGGASLAGGTGQASGTLIGALILGGAAQRPQPAVRLRVLAAGRHRCRHRAGGAPRHAAPQGGRGDSGEPGRPAAATGASRHSRT